MPDKINFRPFGTRVTKFEVDVADRFFFIAFVHYIWYWEVNNLHLPKAT